MSSSYESPENMAASNLFASIYIGALGIIVLGVTIWSIATDKANALSITGGIAVILVSFATSIFFFREYRREKREKAERQAERAATRDQKE